ncbi:MAG: tetratricopeptide repeat protein [Deltaproteobacteria bacterium]|nr:MAG: tetratricopeptide repeat protein [Deltaproteobacteria bacterium]
MPDSSSQPDQTKSINPAAQQLAQKADWRWDENKLEEAIELLKQAIDLAPEYTYARSNLVALLLELERDDDAFPHLARLVDVDRENNPELLNTYGLFLLDREDMEKAEEIFRHTIAVAPDFDSPYGNLGLIFEEKGAYRQAIEAFEEFVNLTDDSEERDEALERIHALRKLVPDEHNETSRSSRGERYRKG